MDLRPIFESVSKSIAFLDETDSQSLADLRAALAELRAGAESQALAGLITACDRGLAALDGGEDAMAELCGEIGAYAAEVLEALELDQAVDSIPVPGAAPAERVEAADDGPEPELLGLFIGSANDNLADLEEALLELENTSEEPDELLAQVKRSLHTIKGECGVIPLPEAAALCHAAEDVFDRIAQGGGGVPIPVLLEVCDWLSAYCQQLAAGDTTSVPPHAELLESLGSAGPGGAPNPPPAPAAVEVPSSSAGPGERIAFSQEILEDEILPDFIGEAREHIEASEAALLELEHAPEDDELINAIFRAFHTIKGVAGYLNLEPMVELAHTAEALMDQLRKGEATCGKRHLDLIFTACDVMGALVSALEGGEGPPVAAHRRLVAALEREIAGDEPASAAQVAQELPAGAQGNHRRMLEILIDQGLMTEKVAEVLLARQAAMPRPKHIGELALDTGLVTAAHIEAALAIQAEEEANGGPAPRPAAPAPQPKASAPAEEPAPSEPQASPAPAEEPASPAPTPFVPRATPTPVEPQATPTPVEPQALSTPAPPANEPVASAPAEPPAPAPARVPARVPAARAVPEPTEPVEPAERVIEAIPKPQPPAAKPQPPAAKPTPKAANRNNRIARTIKVNTGRLDALVDLVGELVIAQQMVYQDPALETVASERLTRNLAQVAKITRDMHEAAMSLRMVTLKPTFQKMARLVRDVSLKAGKGVELVLTGEDTELDRNVVEEISDPMVHLIRNAIDHGLELPSERVAAGKSETGRVELRASHQGGAIVIEIVDDGRGLSRDKILAKAAEKGCLPADTAPEDLTDGQVWDLIFQPGFSTAASVSDISGRGVGMDVVRRNIEKMRGKVEITSQAGKGSVFTLRLPLTLAIIDGMVVRVGAQRYVLPTLSIEQSFRPRAEQLHGVMNEDEVVKVRDMLLPIHRLRDLFEQADGEGDPERGILVVLEEGGERCCLMVDEILGQQQIVIKSLGEAGVGLSGISGGAILGDGRIALIVDVDGLVTRTTQAAA